MSGTVTARTIITENPSFADADELREHARTAPTVPSLILDQLATNFPDREFYYPSTINSKFTFNTVFVYSRLTVLSIAK